MSLIVRKCKLSDGSFLVTPDSHNRISLGKNGKGLYRLTENDYGYTLERIDIINKQEEQVKADV